MAENLYDLESDKVFLGMAHKTQSINEKTDKLHFIKNFCSATDKSQTERAYLPTTN